MELKTLIKILKDHELFKGATQPQPNGSIKYFCHGDDKNFDIIYWLPAQKLLLIDNGIEKPYTETLLSYLGY